MKRIFLSAGLGLLLFASGVFVGRESRPLGGQEIGPLIVVGKTLKDHPERPNGFPNVCVQYRAFGKTEETCPPFSSGDLGNGRQCYGDAIIGEPLPKSCLR